MVFIALYPASYPTDPFFIPAIVGFYIFLLACAGFVLGSILVKKVKGKFMIIGSAVYWVFTFLYLSYAPHQNSVIDYLYRALWSTFLVFFIDITYAVRYIVGKRKQQSLC
jgi:hypothetical protein